MRRQAGGSAAEIRDRGANISVCRYDLVVLLCLVWSHQRACSICLILATSLIIIRASAFPMPGFAPVTTAAGMSSITVLLSVSIV